MVCKREKSKRRDTFFSKNRGSAANCILVSVHNHTSKRAKKKSMAYFSLLDSGPNFLLGCLGENKARSVFLFHNHTASIAFVITSSTCTQHWLFQIMCTLPVMCVNQMPNACNVAADMFKHQLYHDMVALISDDTYHVLRVATVLSARAVVNTRFGQLLNLVV